VIQDMRRDCTGADIADEVRASGVSGWNGFMMGRALGGLRRRACAPAEFRRLAAASAFGACDITA
jgi:hypothetical protein